jgi:hypothetical protein
MGRPSAIDEKLRGNLSDRVRRVPLRHGDNVGGHEIARHVVEGNLADDPDVRGRRPARSAAPGGIDTHQRQHHARPERADRLDQIVDALVATRRPEKHDDLAGAYSQPLARRGAIVPGGIPGVRVAHVRQKRSAEATLQETGGHCDRVRARDEPLGEPDPRKPVGIGEVEGSTDAAPEARAGEEADLPVVDVEHQRAPAPGAGEQAQPEARRAWLGGDEHITVNELEQARNTLREPGIATDSHATLWNRPLPRGHPDIRAEARPDDLDIVPRGQKPREQVRATRRVVRQVGGEDGNLHAAPAATRLV